MAAHSLGVKRMLADFSRKALLSALVLSVPLGYVGISYLRQELLPDDKPAFVHWSGLDPHSEVFVTWETADETRSVIQYGTDPKDLAFRAEEDTLQRLHRFHLTDLSPNRQYYYRSGSCESALGMLRTFRTAPPADTEEPFNVTFISDTQQVLGIGYYNKVASSIRENLDTAFVVNVGDLTDTAEDQGLWNLYFAESTYLDRFPLVPCPGNHDAIDRPGSKYPHYFGTTENDKDVYYSFDWGSAFFVVAQIGNQSHVDPADPDNADHFRWLRETLAGAQDRKYRILIYHINRLHIMSPIVEEYNVSLVMHGHAHAYSRYTFQGHTYVCLGNGATLQVGTERKDSYVQKKTHGAGFTRLTFHLDGVQLETFTPTMDVMDSAFLRRNEDNGVLLAEDALEEDRSMTAEAAQWVFTPAQIVVTALLSWIGLCWGRIWTFREGLPEVRTLPGFVLHVLRKSVMTGYAFLGMVLLDGAIRICFLDVLSYGKWSYAAAPVLLGVGLGIFYVVRSSFLSPSWTTLATFGAMGVTYLYRTLTASSAGALSLALWAGVGLSVALELTDAAGRRARAKRGDMSGASIVSPPLWNCSARFYSLVNGKVYAAVLLLLCAELIFRVEGMSLLYWL